MTRRGKPSKRETLCSMPAWLAALPSDARPSKLDLAIALGYSSLQGFENAYSKGLWPELKELRAERGSDAKPFVNFSTYKVMYRVPDIRRFLKTIIRGNQNELSTDSERDKDNLRGSG